MLEPLIHGLKDWATSIVNAIGYPGLGILMFLDAANIPIPSEIIMPLGGMLAAQGKMNIHIAAFSGAVGSTLGSCFSYWIGATLGKPFLLKYGKFVLLRPKEVEHAERWYLRYGLVSTLWGRFVPLMRTFVSFPAGIFRADFRIFVLYAFAGSLPWCYAWAYAGYHLGRNWSVVEANLKYVDIAIIVGLVLLIGRFLYYRFRNNNNNETEAVLSES